MHNLYAQDCFCWESVWDMVWIYHNEDATSGDQFVKNYITSELLKDAVKEHGATLKPRSTTSAHATNNIALTSGMNATRAPKSCLKTRRLQLG